MKRSLDQYIDNISEPEGKYKNKVAKSDHSLPFEIDHFTSLPRDLLMVIIQMAILWDHKDHPTKHTFRSLSLTSKLLKTSVTHEQIWRDTRIKLEAFYGTFTERLSKFYSRASGYMFTGKSLSFFWKVLKRLNQYVRYMEFNTEKEGFLSIYFQDICKYACGKVRFLTERSMGLTKNKCVELHEFIKLSKMPCERLYLDFSCDGTIQATVESKSGCVSHISIYVVESLCDKWPHEFAKKLDITNDSVREWRRIPMESINTLNVCTLSSSSPYIGTRIEAKGDTLIVTLHGVKSSVEISHGENWDPVLVVTKYLKLQLDMCKIGYQTKSYLRHRNETIMFGIVHENGSAISLAIMDCIEPQ